MGVARLTGQDGCPGPCDVGSYAGCVAATVGLGLHWWPHRAESEKDRGALRGEEGGGRRHAEGGAIPPALSSLADAHCHLAALLT